MAASTRLRPGLSTGTPQNVAYRLEKVARHTALTGHWLDCGGCDGQYAKGLLDRGVDRVTVTDIDASRISHACELWRHEERLDFRVCAAEELSLDDEAFDGVLLNEVLEHVRDERMTLREIGRVLKPQKPLALFSPNRWFPFEGHGLNVRGRPFHKPAPLVPWLPKRLTSHYTKARNYWPHELRQLVQSAGLTVVATDWALPVLTDYPWLPQALVDAYQAHLVQLDALPLRRMGVSTLVVARRPYGFS